MNREFFATALSKKPELLRAMLAFNGLQTATPIPDALAALPNAEALWRQEAVRRRFGVASVAEPDFWDFENEAFRLALLEATTLHRLIMTFGVAVLAPELCRLLRREDVRDARERLGEALYAYALHRARFQVNGAVVPPDIRGPQGAPVDVRARAVGEWGLHAVTAGWPEVLRRCFALTDSLPVTASEPGLDPEGQRQLWIELKKVLLKEVAPAWAPCFD